MDSHCHLHDKEFFTPEVAEKYLKLAYKNEVKKIICIGTDHADSLRARDFAEKYTSWEELSKVYWVYGVHPSNLEKWSEINDMSNRGNRTFDSLLEKTRGEIRQGILKPVAIGEIGLDYHYTPYDRELQIKGFEMQLQLAVDTQLPVVFHIREAFDDFFGVLKNFPALKNGVVHSFSDSKENLARVLAETPFYVGVNGMATFAKIPLPPLDRTLLETDAPFLAPVPHRGKQNHSAYIKNIAEFLSEKHGEGFRVVAKNTTLNAEKLFGI